MGECGYNFGILNGSDVPKAQAKFSRLSKRLGAERTAAMLEGYRTGRGSWLNSVFHKYIYDNLSKKETKIMNCGVETLAHLEVLKTTDAHGKQMRAVRALSEMYCPSKTVALVKEAIGSEKIPHFLALLGTTVDKLEVNEPFREFVRNYDGADVILCTRVIDPLLDVDFMGHRR